MVAEVVFAMLAIIPLGAWWMVFRPHNQAEAQMRKQLEEKQAKLRKLNETTGMIAPQKACRR